MEKKHPLSCSFCGKMQTEVRFLITGPLQGDLPVNICAECTDLCVDILDERVPIMTALRYHQTKANELLEKIIKQSAKETVNVQNDTDK